MAVTEPAIELSEVCRTHRGGRTIGPVSFAVEPGTCFGLVGANGAGKTTVLRAVLGLDRPSSGTVRVLGRRVEAGVATHQVSGLIEEPRFFGWLGAADNLRCTFAGRPAALGRVDQVLDSVGLGDLDRQPVRTFSQGMRQRLGLARVLVGDPQVLVLDEPTNGLDPEGIRWLRGLVTDLGGAGRTVLLSSHLLHEVQASASGFAMLEQGRVIAAGAVGDLDGVASLEDLYFRALDR